MVNEFVYKTIKEQSEGTFTDKGSKFYSYALPILKFEDCKNLVKRLTQQHKGARHFCYGLRIGKLALEERSSDDGEPSGTAGKPILNQLKKSDLHDVCIVVVRHFGGTKLGTKGLINAYKESAKDAIQMADIITKEILTEKTFDVRYDQYAHFMDIMKHYQVKSIIERPCPEHITIHCNIPYRIQGQFVREIQKLNSDKG